MKIRSIKSLKKIAGRRFLVRVDFNLPLENGQIKDDYRLRRGIHTIDSLCRQGGQVIVITHLGDPSGYDPTFSCLPLAKRLAAVLKRQVSFVPGPISAMAGLPPLKNGGLVMLDNLRFDQGEKKDSPVFASQLANLADIYINDAFSVCHRRQASVSAIAKLLPAYAGLLLEEELHQLSAAFSPVKPLSVLMGGAKISTKAPMIAKLKPGAAQIMLGGALANTFLAHLGYEVGKSLYDKEGKKLVYTFVSKGRLEPKIILPSDVAVRDRSGRACRRVVSEVKKSDTILDIGPDTIMAYSRMVSRARTIIWNGPMGKYEEAPFRSGTMALASAVAARSRGRALGLVGGGETVEALRQSKMEEYVDFISTGGGAMLAFLGKQPMPGLRGIMKR